MAAILTKHIDSILGMRVPHGVPEKSGDEPDPALKNSAMFCYFVPAQAVADTAQWAGSTDNFQADLVSRAAVNLPALDFLKDK